MLFCDRIKIRADHYRANRVSYSENYRTTGFDIPVMAEDEKEVYTVKEVGKMLGCSPDTVKKWIKSGKIKGKKMLNNRWVVHKSEIQRIFKDPEGSGSSASATEVKKKINQAKGREAEEDDEEEEEEKPKKKKKKGKEKSDEGKKEKGILEKVFDGIDEDVWG